MCEMCTGELFKSMCPIREGAVLDLILGNEARQVVVEEHFSDSDPNMV